MTKSRALIRGRIAGLWVISLIACVLFGCESQPSSREFETIQINKTLAEFPDEFDLSTPLLASKTFDYRRLNGETNLLAKASYSGRKHYFSYSARDIEISEDEVSDRLRHTILKGIMVYKDSIALSIIKEEGRAITARIFVVENDHWVNFSRYPMEFATLDSANEYFNQNAHKYLEELRHGNRVATEPSDKSVFVDYLKDHRQNPKTFILDKLEQHKLVMYGDIHFRKWSWDLCREVISDVRFAQSTGVVFMELGSDCQKKMDDFMASDTPDVELLLDVFRNYQLDGWDERGKYEFLMDIWQVNQRLPVEKRIKVILIDTPRPFEEFSSLEDLQANRTTADERNIFMAEQIQDYLDKSDDSRSAFFTVGTSHICKTLKSAGAILVSNQSPEYTYSIFTHSPRMDNRMDIPERLRHGVFDYAFYEIRNQPVAFDLKDSPFGKEPFDGFYGEGLKSYQDNYDGYIFFGSLDEEPEGELLIELYSDEFISELNRRYAWYDSDLQDWWELEGSGKESLIQYLIENSAKKRWEGIIAPLP